MLLARLTQHHSFYPSPVSAATGAPLPGCCCREWRAKAEASRWKGEQLKAQQTSQRSPCTLAELRPGKVHGGGGKLPFRLGSPPYKGPLGGAAGDTKAHVSPRTREAAVLVGSSVTGDHSFDEDALTALDTQPLDEDICNTMARVLGRQQQEAARTLESPDSSISTSIV